MDKRAAAIPITMMMELLDKEETPLVGGAISDVDTDDADKVGEPLALEETLPPLPLPVGTPVVKAGLAPASVNEDEETSRVVTDDLALTVVAPDAEPDAVLEPDADREEALELDAEAEVLLEDEAEDDELSSEEQVRSYNGWLLDSELTTPKLGSVMVGLASSRVYQKVLTLPKILQAT